MPKYPIQSVVILLLLVGSVVLSPVIGDRPATKRPARFPKTKASLNATPAPHPAARSSLPPPISPARKSSASAAPLAGVPALPSLHGADRLGAYRRWQAMTAGLGATAASAPVWIPKGPQSEANVGGSGTGFVASGRVTAIAITPNSQTVYIGSAGGGVWRLDPAQPWKPLTDSQPSLSIGALAIDPSNSNTIYAATGEQNNSGDEYLGVGILKSVDRGATWTVLGNSVFNNHTVGAIAVSPANPNLLLAGSRIGVYRSVDAGVTWQRVQPANAVSETTADSVLFDPTTPTTAYASMGGTSTSTQTGVYVSTDSGATWRPINGSGAIALPVASAGRITLVLGPPSSPGLYAGVSQYSNTTQSTPANPVDQEPFLGLYKSTDQGNNWSLISGPAYCKAVDIRSQCDYNNVFAIQPTTNGVPGMMLGGGINLSISLDNGSTWSDVLAPNSSAVAVHSDQHAIVFSPDGSTVYVGNDGGIWSASISGNNLTWADLNPTLTLAQFYPGLSINPNSLNISYGGTQDNNVLAYSGQLQWTSVTGDDGAATAIDPTNPSTVYASLAATDITNPIYKSTDGIHFYASDPATNTSYSSGIDTNSLPFPNFLTIDSNMPSTLYFTGKTMVYRSSNSAGSWTAISGNLTLNAIDLAFTENDQLCHIAVAPTSPHTVYASSCYGAVWAFTQTALSTDLQWIPISAGVPQNMMTYRMTHVIPDPKTSGLLYVTMSQPGTGRVFSTQNHGQTWTDLTNNLPDVEATDLVVDPDIPNTLYVATTMGVYWSNNGGLVWSALGAGLPNSPVTSLVLHQASRTLRAATHGRGVWDLSIPTTANPIPLVTSISPTQIGLNSSPTLTVTGQNFIADSVVLCNGSQLPTTFVCATQLRAPLASCGTVTDSLLEVAVFTPAPSGGQSPEYFLKVGPTAAIFPTGIVNGASFSGYALAPGSIATMFGANFSANSGPPQLSIPLPLNVYGTAVTITDSTSSQPEPVRAYYVSPGQVNFQVPWDVPTSGDGSFVVSNNGVTGPPVTKSFAPFAPGIFVLSAGAPAITFANSLTLPQAISQASAGFATASAKAGDALSIYCTGLGAVSNQPSYGDVSPGPPNLATTMINPTVLIGGQRAQVLYSGLAPGFVGLYQINVVVPEGLPSGSSVSLLITDGVDVRSNTVFIAVQ